jgi:hypothetical protein
MRLLAIAIVPLALAACASPEGAGEEGATGSIEAPLAGKSVEQTVTLSCSTTAVKGLATQLVEEIQCMRPGTMKSIAGKPGLSLGSAVFPFLQTPAADALIKAQASRNATLHVNSGLRALPQQYLLYRWYRTGRCGIGLAASPGTSNHESGLAVDVDDDAAWRGSLERQGFRWLGASDPVHFDYVAGGVGLRGLSVEAFQRLWNRNHPEDRIAEDGDYGPATESRLAKSPSDGFAKGADCDKPAPPPPKPDAGAPSPAPDGGEPPRVDPPAATLPEGETPPSNAPAASEGGCAVSAQRTSSPALFSIAIGLGLALLSLRRRRSGRPS